MRLGLGWLTRGSRPLDQAGCLVSRSRPATPSDGFSMLNQLNLVDLMFAACRWW